MRRFSGYFMLLGILFSLTIDLASQDILSLKKEIELKTPGNIEVGNILNIQSNSSGYLFIHNWTAYVKNGCPLGTQLSVFDSSGNFIRTIGKQGKGDKEIQRFKAFFVHSDKIYIADDKDRCIHVLNYKGEYLYNFNMQSFNCYNLYITDNGDIITYDPVVSQSYENLIQVQNQKQLICKFGSPTIVAKNSFPCPNHGFTLDSKSNIYQVNSHEYKIFKYNLKGELISTFTNDRNLSICKSMPADFPIKPDTSKVYQEKFRNSFDWINYLYLIDDKFLLTVYLSDVLKSSSIYYVDILTLDGDMIKCNIQMPYVPKGSYGDLLYLVAEREEKVDGSFSSQKIMF